MVFTATAIPDVLLVEPEVIGDVRGFFLETYEARKFTQGGIDATFVQDNQSGSRQGVLRGLHYQVCHAQGKLVRAVVGEVFDVAVDLRRDSPFLGRWVGVHLSAENKHQLWIPPGFAHGFYVLSEWAEVFYKVTDYYAPQCDRTLRWDDPFVGIAWPLLDGQTPKLSDKDARGLSFQDAELYEPEPGSK
jgi:dTDP-4-dehydrorhamnose 3,5-epimerase